MAWIEVHQSLPTHRKTLAAADALDMPPPHLLGHMVCLWLWAIDNAPDGVLGVSPRTIARAAQWSGDPQEFLAAVTAAGFLDESGTIHDYGEYIGKLIDRRRQNAERQKRLRDKARLPIYERDNGHCRYCHAGLSVDAFYVDHMLPKERGGTDDPANLVTACNPCNVKKNNRTPEEAGMTLLPIYMPPRDAPRNALRDGVRSANGAQSDASRNPTTVQNSTEHNQESATHSLPVAPAPEALEIPEPLRGFHAVLDGLKGYNANTAFFAKVGSKYGHLDLEEEAIKAREWLASTKARKCSHGFLLNWLSKAAAKAAEPVITAPARNGTAGKPPPQFPPPPEKPADIGKLPSREAWRAMQGAVT
jgi:5-methylcytosine-specific restriction endonuclease McrA